MIDMKIISDKAQEGKLLARKVGSGEYGIMLADDKQTFNAIYWNSKEDAVADLKDVIDYFESNLDE